MPFMSTTKIEAFDTTVQKTNEWLRDISRELGDENRRHAYLALRGTLHAIRDFLPIEESAQLSAQLPMLVRGIYFEAGTHLTHQRRTGLWRAS
jgi:uncharacterized protein (DUF2267 family)